MTIATAFLPGIHSKDNQGGYTKKPKQSDRIHESSKNKIGSHPWTG